MTQEQTNISSFCAPQSIKGKYYALRDAPPFAAPAGIDAHIAAIAAARGVDDLESFFNPNFRAMMPDPERLKGMAEAANRFARAVRDKEMIALVGDYDVDGATSTSIIFRFLRLLGHDRVFWKIPNRILEGYGPNVRIVDEAAEAKVSVLLILDSGTAAIDPVRHSRERGLDVLILDHHEAGAHLPDAVLVNPKQPDEDRSLDYLCTAGIAFLFAVAVLREMRTLGHFAPGAEPDLRELLGLVTLGTVADVVPLVGLNRAYVALGLARMPDILGLRILSEVTGEASFTASTCGFVFGPCINAAGRIDNMDVGIELLVTEDEARARELAERLHELNQERRKMQKAAEMVAKDAVVKTGQNTGDGVIVLHDESWHPGVVGLVAARVREAFDRPAVVIGASGKGSCRSVDGYNVGASIIAACQSGLLLKGGGHAAAAGLTIDPTNFKAFKAYMDETIVGFVAPPVLLDLVVPCGALEPGLVRQFDRLAPFGQGNMKPRVGVVGGFVRRVQILKALHVKAWLSGRDGDTVVLIFNAIGTPMGDALARAEGRYVDVVGTVELSEFSGVTSVVLKPEDLFYGADRASWAA